MPKELRNASSMYGSQMGRSNQITEPNYPVKLHLEKLRFYDGDYDKGGAYWGGGSGAFIFHAWGDASEDEQEVFVRAKDRDEAKVLIRKELVNSKFYR